MSTKECLPIVLLAECRSRTINGFLKGLEDLGYESIDNLPLSYFLIYNDSPGKDNILWRLALTRDPMALTLIDFGKPFKICQQS